MSTDDIDVPLSQKCKTGCMPPPPWSLLLQSSFWFPFDVSASKIYMPETRLGLSIAKFTVMSESVSLCITLTQLTGSLRAQACMCSMKHKQRHQ